MLLNVDNLGISFGGLRAVNGLTVALPAGGLHGLIGPNGAGKTTAFNLLTGVYQPDTGSVKLGVEELRGRSAYQVARAGLARTFQNIRLFGDLSVLDNVRLGAQMRSNFGLTSTLLRTFGFMDRERDVTHHAMELLRLFNLDDRAHEFARNLPYGDQRRLEIARALATKPKVLLLDEPAAGMNPQEKLELMQQIRFIRDRFELGILLIEHDMHLVMSICENITVLDHGETICVGSPRDVQTNPKVIEAYLGE